MKMTIAIAALTGLGAMTAATRPSAELLNTAMQTPARVDEVLKATSTDQEAAQAVAQLIWMIQNADLAETDKKHRISLVVAEAVRLTGEKSAEFIAPLVERINLPLLPVVTASAIVASGARSPAMLDAIVRVAGPAAPSVNAVRAAAANPVAVLGAELAAALPVAAPVVGAKPRAVAPVAASGTQEGRSAPETIEQPLTPPSGSGNVTTGGPRPPGMPPRPPAMPYRGQ